MRIVWRFILRLFGVAEKVHTGLWLAEILGLMAVLTGIFTWAQRRMHQINGRFSIVSFFVAGLALLTLPRLISSQFWRNRKPPFTVGHEAGPDSTAEAAKIQTIEFEYMRDPQDSPLNNGWKWAEKDQSQSVIFRVAYDAPERGSLEITASGFYGIDFALHQGWILSDRLGYSARYVGANAALYTFVTVGFKDGTKDDQLWIAHKVGNGAPVPDGAGSKNWVVFLQGKPISNGWRSFDVSVSDEMRQIFQSRGGFLRHLTALRLRGNLSISPIGLYETAKAG
jgi:hypothetical protein